MAEMSSFSPVPISLSHIRMEFVAGHLDARLTTIFAVAPATKGRRSSLWHKEQKRWV